MYRLPFRNDRKPMSLINPHGGKLVNRVLSPDAANRGTQSAGSLHFITLSPREACDLEMIAIGAFSPLTGFMGEKDFARVCKDMRLAERHGLADPGDPVARRRRRGEDQEGQKVALNDEDGDLLAVMTVTEKYKHDKALEIPNVYKTEDDAHPGVKIVRKQGNFCLAGPIDVITPNPTPSSPIPPPAREDARSVRGQGLADGRRVPDAQPDPPRPRVSHQVRPGDHRRPADPPAGRRDQVRRHPRRRADGVLPSR